MKILTLQIILASGLQNRSSLPMILNVVINYEVVFVLM